MGFSFSFALPSCASQLFAEGLKLTLRVPICIELKVRSCQTIWLSLRFLSPSSSQKACLATSCFANLHSSARNNGERCLIRYLEFPHHPYALRLKGSTGEHHRAEILKLRHRKVNHTLLCSLLQVSGLSLSFSSFPSICRTCSSKQLVVAPF